MATGWRTRGALAWRATSVWRSICPRPGCAKTRLVGDYPMPAGPRGSRSDLKHRGELVGAVLRTRADVAPVFVSVGHRLSLRAATALVLRCAGRFRQPEPLRQAHLAARALSRA